MYSNFNPLVIIISFAVYLYILKAVNSISASKKLISLSHYLSTLTLGIYCIHPFWLDILNNFGLNGFTVGPIIGIPLAAAVAFVLSLASVIILDRIPYVRVMVK